MPKKYGTNYGRCMAIIIISRRYSNFESESNHTNKQKIIASGTGETQVQLCILTSVEYVRGLTFKGKNNYSSMGMK